MIDDASFLRVILADPFDDSPRLLLADWIEEHGGEVQCNQCLGTGMALPAWLWDKLDNFAFSSQCWKDYRTTALANAALSRACVDLGRSLAGLPALTWPAVEQVAEAATV